MKDIQKKISKYLELNEEASQAMKELRDEAIIFAKENRMFHYGDVVEVVLLDDGEFHSVYREGVVGDCKNLIQQELNHNKQMILSLKQYEDEQELNERWNLLRYEIFAKKKDGKASVNHLFHAPHYLPSMDGLSKLCDKKARRFDYAIRRK